MSDEFLEILPEFFEKELVGTIQKTKKKGGPYSKHNRFKRQDEVFKLHFEEGFSTVKIAEILQINRHTISKDIKLGYERLSEQAHYDIESLILKQIYRLEIQRTRLLKQLDNQNRFHERVILEKMILDIDSKIAYIITKSTTTQEHVINGVLKIIERFEREPYQKSHWINSSAFYKVSKKTQEKINELIREDLKDPENYLEEHEVD
jgi:predicted DNA-binding protein YlxM (UPF0122 family)